MIMNFQHTLLLFLVQVLVLLLTSESSFALSFIQQNNIRHSARFLSKSTFQLKNQVEDYDDNNNNNNNFSRRDMMTSSFTSLLTATSVTATATNSRIPQNANAASTIRINQYPPLEYLEPIYELKLSIQALQQGITNPTKR
eukprot:839833_1